jgi:hypothetical protein
MFGRGVDDPTAHGTPAARSASSHGTTPGSGATACSRMISR